jgi:hypothetical protein
MVNNNLPSKGTQNVHDDDQPMSPFVTTSDVMNELNKHLAALSSPSDDAYLQPSFQLQKKLPNGSTIPATSDEIAAADFKTKLEQSASFVSQLATPEDRQYWAEQQRQMGNAFFGRGDYKGAMDIYLTCLVVKENTPNFVNDTLLPVLNNLAQCTTQLGMHKKTILFCEMALQEASNAEEQYQITADDNNHDDKEETQSVTEKKSYVIDPISLCKIHFKKAKSFRLTGEYASARMALNASLDQLEKKEKEWALNQDTNSSERTTLLKQFQQAIQKELRYLETAEKEARKNRQRQKRAMQRVLSASSKQTTSEVTSNKDYQENKKNAPAALYEDKSSSTPRQFSSLRARKNASTKTLSTSSSPGTKNNAVPEEIQLSYMQYYWKMVARVARFMLNVLGDDEPDSEEYENGGKRAV